MINIVKKLIYTYIDTIIIKQPKTIMPFKFSVENPRFESFYAAFNVKVSDDSTSFTLKESVILRRNIAGIYYYMHDPDHYADPDNKNYIDPQKTIVNRVDKGTIAAISDTSHMFGVGDQNNSITGSLCGIPFSVTTTETKFGGIVLPENIETRDSFVRLFEHFNEQFDKFDNRTALNMLNDYVTRAYMSEKKIKDIGNGKYLNKFFRSAVAGSEFKANYTKMLLEYGTI